MQFVSNKCLTPCKLSDTKKSSICISNFLQIIPELYVIPLSGSFSLLKKDILKMEHGTCFISTLDARIPNDRNVFSFD